MAIPQTVTPHADDRALTVVDSASAQLAPTPNLIPTITLEKLRAMRAVIAPDLNDGELAFFAEVCNALGLSPLLRQIHATKRGDKPVFQTGIDGYRLLAARTRQLVGIDEPVYDTEDADHPNRASVTVYRWQRGQRIPYTATARWNEYVQKTRDGKIIAMWAKMPYLMLGKCCEALALRRAFPAELSGIYTDDEMMQADNPMPAPAPYVEQASQSDAPRYTEQPVANPAARRPLPAQAQSSRATHAAYNPLADRDLRMALNARGIRTVEQVQAFVADTCGKEAVTREALLNALAEAQEPEMIVSEATLDEDDDTQQYIPNDLHNLNVGARGN